MKYSFPNPDDNEWIKKYNELVDQVAKDEDLYKKIKKESSILIRPSSRRRH